MSQQVYANERQKYYPCPGVNTFALSVPQLIGGGSTARVQYNADDIIQVFDQVSASAGNITFQQEGIYSVKMRLGFAPEPFSATQDPDLSISMVLAAVGAANGLSLCGMQDRFIGRGASVGSDGFITEIAYTGYFAKGDVVYCDITSNDTAFAVQLNLQHTIVIVCKLV